MKYTKWEVRPVAVATATRKEIKYQVYRLELGGNFDDREDAEHLAYELNREATDGADK